MERVPEPCPRYVTSDVPLDEVWLMMVDPFMNIVVTIIEQSSLMTVVVSE